MQSFVDNTLASYFDQRRSNLELQKAKWQMDKCARGVMNLEEGQIELEYVQQIGQTHFQPCDIETQCVFNQLLKQSSQGNDVEEVSEQLMKELRA
jgi:hypothetical protein